MHIRAAAAGDVEPMVRLFGQLGYATEAARLKQQLAAIHENAMAQAFVAEDVDGIAGAAVVHLIAPLHVSVSWALLSALVVDDERRSAGIGALLLRAAECYARRHGCSQLELSSNVSRSRAHLFYERHGYQEKRRRFVKMLPK